MKILSRRHWYTVFVGLSWTVIAGVVLIAYFSAPETSSEQNAVSCSLAEQVERLQIAVETMEATQIHFELDIRERMMQMSHSVGVGDVDVACLYRGHVLQTHDGHVTRAVRDKPVPGAWDPLSPLIEPPTRAECMERFR